jgi:hypothetical protein
VPVATAWGGVVAVVREPAGSRSRDLFTCFAVVSLLFLYPSADFWHVLMGLPAFLPLLAHLADRWVGRPQSFSTADRSRVAIAAAVATALLLATCTPFVAALAHARRAPTVPGLARAPGIADPSPEFRNIVALLAWLDRVPPERPLAVLVNRQLLYLLADRSSALASGEFVLYGIGFDVLPAERARALLPPAYVTERLDEARPVVIEREDGGAQRFRRIYPEAARQLDEHYAEVARFGPYRVLDRTD